MHDDIHTVSKAAPIFGTGLPLAEPSQDAGVAEPVAAGGLVWISLAEQADGALEALVQFVHEIEVVAALVVVLRGPRRHVRRCTEEISVSSYFGSAHLRGRYESKCLSSPVLIVDRNSQQSSMSHLH